MFRSGTMFQVRCFLWRAPASVERWFLRFQPTLLNMLTGKVVYQKKKAFSDAFPPRQRSKHCPFARLLRQYGRDGFPLPSRPPGCRRRSTWPARWRTDTPLEGGTGCGDSPGHVAGYCGAIGRTHRDRRAGRGQTRIRPNNCGQTHSGTRTVTISAAAGYQPNSMSFFTLSARLSCLLPPLPALPWGAVLRWCCPLQFDARVLH